MDLLSVLVAILYYAAALVFAGGLGLRIRQYLATPAPFKIPLTPAPVTRGGVALRLLRELVLFESLFRASRWTWFLGWTFHAALVVLLVYHLRHALFEPGPLLAAAERVGTIAAVGLVLALTGLLVRRVAVDRVRYVSAPSDYLMLLFLLAIAGTGMLARHVVHLDILALEQYARGWLRLAWAPLPPGVALTAHLVSAAVLLLVFPFSKLLHAPGFFFSPTSYQADDARERRYVAPERRER